MTEDTKDVTHECLSCGIEVKAAKSENIIGEEFICDSCRDQMVESLEEAWKKHSAFLDAALN